MLERLIEVKLPLTRCRGGVKDVSAPLTHDARTVSARRQQCGEGPTSGITRDPIAGLLKEVGAAAGKQRRFKLVTVG